MNTCHMRRPYTKWPSRINLRRYANGPAIRRAAASAFGLVPLGFLWVAIAGVAGCGCRRAGLRRGSEVGRGMNLRRDPRESRMDRIVRAGRNGGRETKVAPWIPPRYFAAASGRQSAGAFTPRGSPADSSTCSSCAASSWPGPPSGHQLNRPVDSRFWQSQKPWPS